VQVAWRPLRRSAQVTRKPLEEACAALDNLAGGNHEAVAALVRAGAHAALSEATREAIRDYNGVGASTLWHGCHGLWCIERPFIERSSRGTQTS
jgi:hypothetical protein